MRIIFSLLLLFLATQVKADGSNFIVIDGNKVSIESLSKQIWPEYQNLNYAYENGEEFPYNHWFISTFDFKKASFLADRLIVLAEIMKNGCSEEKGSSQALETDAQFAIFKKNGNNYVLESKTPAEVSNNPYEWTSETSTSSPCMQNFYSHDLKLDFAPYMITKTDRAFGYRVTANSHHANEDSDKTRLFLYHLAPGSDNPTKVLELDVESSSEMDGKSGGKSSTNIVVTNVEKNGAFVWNANTTSESDSKKSKSVSKLVWNGKAYQP